MICTHCKKDLPEQMFSYNKTRKSRNYKDDLCRECKKLKKEQYYHSKQGVIQTIYDSQKQASIRRKHSLPSYSKQELIEWLENNNSFNSLYTRWVESNYQKDLKPSIDRLDDFKPYTLDNIRIVTFHENLKKGHSDRVNGIGTQGKLCKRVIQLSLDNIFIKEWYSIQEIQRVLNINHQNIVKVCQGKRKTAGGYKWRYL